jgi:hypothetical protein
LWKVLQLEVDASATLELNELVAAVTTAPPDPNLHFGRVWGYGAHERVEWREATVDQLLEDWPWRDHDHLVCGGRVKACDDVIGGVEGTGIDNEVVAGVLCLQCRQLARSGSVL